LSLAFAMLIFGLSWTAPRYGAGFVISLVLAHLLTPSDHGLIGMMAVFTELLASVFDWSIGPAVVHFYEEGKANEIPLAPGTDR